jgi:hypothetical protein
MEIAAHDTDFFLRLEKLQTPRSVFESQGEMHGEIDLRLVQMIEGILVPILGRWEQSTHWFHQIDFYGDGVRSLTFSRSAFPYEQVNSLQQLLRGEHEPFCILCIATDKLGGTANRAGVEHDDDYLAIFSGRMLATKTLAAILQ